MTVSQRLRTTATGLFCAGQSFSSEFARQMADQCDRMGPIGESLYANWAAQLEERLARVTQSRSGLDPAADALNMGDGHADHSN